MQFALFINFIILPDIVIVVVIYYAATITTVIIITHLLKERDYNQRKVDLTTVSLWETELSLKCECYTSNLLPYLLINCVALQTAQQLK